jgi:glycosyltransferase involved in cell wall biosynthesis
LIVPHIKIIEGFVGRMKVALVAYGHADNVLCLSHHLSKYVDITVIFVTAGTHFTRSIFDWDISQLPYGLTTARDIVQQYIDERITRYIGPKVTIYLARTPTFKILKDWKLHNVRYIKEVANYINKNFFDVVHFNGSSGFQSYFHFFLRKIPKVYTIHDYLPHSGDTSFPRGFVTTLFNRFYTHLNYEFIQHYQFLSEKFSEFYGVNSDRVHTVYCGPFEIYKTFVDGHVKEEKHTVLFFGRISPYKGIEYLMKAAPLVRAHIPDAKFIIAGKGNFQLDVDRRGGYEIRNYHVSNEELVHLVQRSSVVVVPYTDATHSAVIMTAYAFNKPVIATTVGGFTEVVHDNITGRLVPPRHPHALADAIIDTLSNSAKRKIMKSNIDRESIHGKLSWDHNAQQTLEIYKRAQRRYLS